jgi:hypothetical protein
LADDATGATKPIAAAATAKVSTRILVLLFGEVLANARGWIKFLRGPVVRNIGQSAASAGSSFTRAGSLSRV